MDEVLTVGIQKLARKFVGIQDDVRQIKAETIEAVRNNDTLAARRARAAELIANMQQGERIA